ncbi:MAG TPA: shikimate kinase, partial [Lachnospiraceae bacterium]|nr:shikimate kinase [Lachnospiraceae bacterium]
LDLESRIHQNITAERTVIAPGGSVVMEEEAMRHLQEIGTIVYLQMDLDMALDRLHDPKKRGVVLEEGETIETLYYKRLPLYEKYAEITVNERGHALEDLVIQILTKLHGH